METALRHDRSDASQNVGSTEQHQNNDKHDGSDQPAQKNGAAKRRRENDFTAAGLFSRIWLLVHAAAPSESRIEHFVGSARRGRLLRGSREPEKRSILGEPNMR